MKWSPVLFVLSFVLIIIGVILLFIPTEGIGNGFVFIFPFFYFGGTQSFNFIFLIGGGILLFVVMIYLMHVMTTNVVSTVGQKSGVMAVGSYCEFCESPIPVNATYCPNCGHEVDYDRLSRDEF